MARVLNALASSVISWHVGALLFAVALLAASDFGLSVFGRTPFIATIALSGIVWLITPKRNADPLVLGLALATLVLCASNLLIKGTFNFVTFVPVFAMLALASVGNRGPAQLRLALDVVSFILVPGLMFAELLTKLSLINVPLIAELTSGNATGNFYPLRLQSPFSSPLSLSSFFLGLFVAYLFFLRSPTRAAIVLALVLFTGSRVSALLIGVSLVIFVLYRVFSGRIGELWSTRTEVVGTIAPPFLAIGAILLIDLLVDQPVWENTVGRILGLMTPDAAGEALSGRRVTLASALSLLANAANVFFIGSRQVPLHDSAFLQIAWESGILSTLLFFGLFYGLLFRTKIAFGERIWIAIAFTVSAAVVGDTTTPSVGMIYFATLLLCQRDIVVGPK